ncbi:MAG: hypothetical protein L0Y58_19345 [Verrucomicrobia subdivision 3 bacterium]|nr:hypothetical protein [Limisphaerales bacterium]
MNAKKKILILDDDADYTALMLPLLVNLGYIVEAENVGANAGSRARAFQPDVILLDVYWGTQNIMWWQILETLGGLREVRPRSIVGLTSKLSPRTLDEMGRRIEDELEVIHKDEVDAHGLVDRLQKMGLL